MKRRENSASWIAVEQATNTVQDPFFAINLTDLYAGTGTFKPIFNTAGFTNCRKARISSWKWNFHWTSGNELAQVNFNVFVVKLRKAGAKLYDYEDGTYALKNLTNQVHYYRAMTGITTPGSNSRVFLNPVFFKTLMRKSFVIGQFGANGSTDYQGTNKKYMSYTVKRKYWFEATGADTTNKYWYNQRTPLLPTDQVFLLCFNDNFSTDLEYPTFDSSALIRAVCYNT